MPSTSREGGNGDIALWRPDGIRSTCLRRIRNHYEERALRTIQVWRLCLCFFSSRRGPRGMDNVPITFVRGCHERKTSYCSRNRGCTLSCRTADGAIAHSRNCDFPAFSSPRNLSHRLPNPANWAQEWSVLPIKVTSSCRIRHRQALQRVRRFLRIPSIAPTGNSTIGNDPSH